MTKTQRRERRREKQHEYDYCHNKVTWWKWGGWMGKDPHSDGWIYHRHTKAEFKQSRRELIAAKILERYKQKGRLWLRMRRVKDPYDDGYYGE